MRFRTLAVHAGQDPDPSTGATIPPIHLSSTFTQDRVGRHKGYEYARVANPTRTDLETMIAALENARYGAAYASGMAAIHAIFSILEPGAHTVLSSDVYGGTYRLVDKLLASRGITYAMVDTSDPGAVAAAVTPETRLVFTETITNPLLKLPDIKALKKAAGRNVILAVDNTFASPYLRRPLEEGADIVVHSSTKYLAGHSDVIGGLVITRDRKTAEGLRFVQKTVGAVPSPLDCYLTIRGIKTLAVRMDAHERNARAVAELLRHHPRVKETLYPGLSGIVSFRIDGGETEARRFAESLRVFALAESLGGVESLVSLPAFMTHAAFDTGLRAKLGITDDLVRLSVGIEDQDDLLEDISAALR
ncbi:MAG: PLP-dependent aspartate aminotransferase family protein [Actinomycetota bacterium]